MISKRVEEFKREGHESNLGSCGVEKLLERERGRVGSLRDVKSLIRAQSLLYPRLKVSTHGLMVSTLEDL